MVENNVEHVCLSYFGQAVLQNYEIDYRFLPKNENFISTDALNCVVAISATSLYSRAREYSWLLDYEPTDFIGYSIFIYDLRKE